VINLVSSGDDAPVLLPDHVVEVAPTAVNKLWRHCYGIALYLLRAIPLGLYMELRRRIKG
jgi:hypothetical protein